VKHSFSMIYTFLCFLIGVNCCIVLTAVQPWQFQFSLVVKEQTHSLRHVTTMKFYGIATSNHHQDGLYIWSVPACAAGFHSIEANQKTTRLNTNRANISAMFFSKNRCVLVSCGLNKPIQVWTPFKLPQIPTENKLQ